MLTGLNADEIVRVISKQVILKHSHHTHTQTHASVGKSRAEWHSNAGSVASTPGARTTRATARSPETCIILALLWGAGQISDFVKLCCCSPEGLLPQGQSMLLLALQSGIFWYLVRDLILHISVTYTSSTPRQWEYILFSKAGNHLGSPSHSLCYRWNSQDQSNKVLLQNQEQGMQV